jgi:phosphomannomutase
MFNPEIFKAYDIRGIFDLDFDLDFAFQLGQAFIALRKKDEDYKNGSTLKILVARDMRLSSPDISNRLIAGLQAAGAKVIDAGLLSTPAFYYNVSAENTDGGLMISASHNPKEWNGFKMVRTKSVPISGETGVSWLKNNINKNLKFNLSESSKQTEVLSKGAEKQLTHDLKYLHPDKIKNFRIIADTANGMGAQFLELLEKNLPIIIEKINFNLDGSFPVHEADPLKPENIKQLSEAIINRKADLGIATDGDGDRIFFLDNLGQLINPAIIRGLLAQIFLKDKPGSKICYDVRPGKITIDLIKEAGGTPVPSRVGHSLIKEQMLAEGAYFAGESSGHFFLNLEIGCFEMPIIMIGRLLELFSEQTSSIADFIKPYRRYSHSGEINLSVSHKDKVLKLIQEKYPNAKISLLDGVSVSYPDYWFNVRASNTEDKVRLNLEANKEKIMINKRDEILKLIKST